MSDLVENPEDRFCRDKAHFTKEQMKRIFDDFDSRHEKLAFGVSDCTATEHG